MQSSVDLTLEHIRALVYGPPGEGKTFSCISMSQHCPADFSHVVRSVAKHEPVVKLADMLWICFDSGATDGFKDQGYEVPMLNLARTGDDLLGVLRDTTALVKKQVDGGATKVIVVDTISALDEINVVYWRNKGFEKWDLWNNVKITHLRFAMALKACKAHVLFLCHAKALMDPADKAQADKIKASGLAAIVPAISGDSLNHYRKDASFEFPVLRSKEGGIDGHWFYTDKSRGFEAKSRIQLPSVVPADWRPILTKAKG